MTSESAAATLNAAQINSGRKLQNSLEKLAECGTNKQGTRMVRYVTKSYTKNFRI